MHIRNLITYLLIILSTIILYSCQSSNINIKNGNPVKIAIIIPDSNNLADKLTKIIENSLNKNALSKLTINKYNDKNIENSIKMMKSNPPDIIIGPIFTQDVPKIANFANKHNIPIITLSNNAMLATTYNIFVFGHRPMEAETRLINYFISMGYKDFVVIIPNNYSSRSIYHYIEDILLKHDIEIKISEFMNSDILSVKKSIKNIVNLVDSLNESDDQERKIIIYIKQDSVMNDSLYKYIKEYYLDEKSIIFSNNLLLFKSKNSLEMIFAGAISMYNSDDTSSSFLEILSKDIGKLVANSIGVNFSSDLFITRLNKLNNEIFDSGYLTFNHMIAERKYDIIKRTADGRFILVDHVK